jgi:hypothetical protein
MTDDDTASTQGSMDKTPNEHDSAPTTEALDTGATTSETPVFLQSLLQEKTAWPAMTATERQIEKIIRHTSRIVGIAGSGHVAAMDVLDRHVKLTSSGGRRASLLASTVRLPAAVSRGAMADFSRFSTPALTGLDQSSMMRVFQGPVANGSIRALLPRSLLPEQILTGQVAALAGVSPMMHLAHITRDAPWSKGVLRVNQQLPGLLASQLQGLNTILGISALRFASPDLDMQLMTLGQTFSDQGWLVDALLLSVSDEELPAVMEILESASDEKQPDHLLTLLHSVRPALTSNVEAALRDLLSPVDAKDFIRDALHAFLSALLDEDGLRGRAYALVPPSALARTEGVFKRAMHRADLLTKVQQQVLFGNRPRDSEVRDEALDALHDAFINRPFRGRRTAIQISALDRFRQQRTSFTSREEGPIPTRHHTLRDGAGTGTHEYALRTFLYFCSVTLMLQAWLTPPSPTVS